MKNFLKYLFFTVIAVIIALALVFSAAVIKYRSLAPSADVSVETLKPLGQDKIGIGEKREFHAEIEVPWNLVPLEILFILPDGLQEIPCDNFSLFGLGWGKWKWKIKGLIQAYRPGDYKGIEGELIYSVKGKKQEPKKIRISDFTVIPFELKDDEIKIAGKIEPKKTYAKFAKAALAALAVLGLIIAALVFIRRRKIEKSKPVSAWQKAMNLLRDLRISRETGMIEARICVSRLTDIIRDYLEERFGIDAPAMTTDEFLENLKTHRSPLSNEHKNFLSDFMRSAELVKFAAAPADSELIENAVSRAEVLVQSTIPNEDILRAEYNSADKKEEKPR
jgi:hypothetical protein